MTQRSRNLPGAKKAIVAHDAQPPVSKPEPTPNALRKRREPTPYVKSPRGYRNMFHSVRVDVAEAQIPEAVTDFLRTRLGRMIGESGDVDEEHEAAAILTGEIGNLCGCLADEIGTQRRMDWVARRD